LYHHAIVVSIGCNVSSMIIVSLIIGCTISSIIGDIVSSIETNSIVSSIIY